MAHVVDSRIRNQAGQVRDLLAALENATVRPASANVEELLQHLDETEALLAEVEAQEIEMRPEHVRWNNIVQRLDSQPKLIATAAAGLPGGLAALRQNNPPAESFWWHADTIQMQRTRKKLLKTARTLGIVVVVLGAAYWLFMTIFPPDPHAVAVLRATSDIERLVDTQEWDEALAVAETSLLAMPGDPEVGLWVAVAAEQAGKTARAEEVLAQIKAGMAEQPILYWLLLGERRLRAGDLDGSRAAAEAALAIEPENPEILLLMGRVAMLANDRAMALDYLDQAYNLALETNPQLAVHARVLYSDLLQQLPAQETSVEETEDPVENQENRAVPTQDAP